MLLTYSNNPGLNDKPSPLWVGLTNPDGVTCVNSGCSSKLKWIDGADFYWDSTVHSLLLASAAFSAFGYNVESKEFGTPINAKYVCVASCLRELKI